MLKNKIRIDRNELAGSFGDIGTDLPLLLAVIPAAGLDAASVFTVYGLMQILTGFVYGLPMPVQPLKAMAVLIVTQKIGGPVVWGGGLAIGVVMLALTSFGLLDWFARVVPMVAVRGVQVGLGLSLVTLALKTYVPSMGWTGYALAACCFAVGIAFWQNRKLPAALFMIGIGVIYSAIFTFDFHQLEHGLQIHLPLLGVPRMDDIWQGFLLLALPQIPLSLSNSVVATHQTAKDLFPDSNISIRKIGWTYSLMNLVAPFVGAMPVCHGCGGLAGHYAFGARTGGSVVIYGLMYLFTGLFFSGIAGEVLRVFPPPVLGVVLFFESIALMEFVGGMAGDRRALVITLIVASMSFTLPNGFILGMLTGVALDLASRRFSLLGEK
jgi:MFS superfamily sulfate permease-like transporter